MKSYFAKMKSICIFPSCHVVLSSYSQTHTRTHIHIYLYVYMCVCIYSILPLWAEWDTSSIPKQGIAGLNSVSFLLDWLPYQGWRTQFALLFTHGWRVEEWIHAFPKNISTKWNVNFFVMDLILQCSFLMTKALCYLPLIYIYIYIYIIMSCH